MKVFLFATLIAVCTCARLENNYLPPPGASGAGGGPGLVGPGFGGHPGHGGNAGLGGFQGAISQQGAAAGGPPSGPQQPPIEILSYENENSGDGNYKFSYETANGIRAQEQGELKNKGTEQEAISVSGSYSYTAPDGQVITVTYIADENGFQPQGDHLPTPPPIPEEIRKALEATAAAQANNPQIYPSGPSGSGYPSGPANNGYPSAPSNNGYPSGGPVRQPNNQYVPPPQSQQPQRPAQRPSGNGGYNPQSGYSY